MVKPIRLTQDMINIYTAKGYWDQKSICDVLKENTDRYPEKEALVDSERRLNWRELDRITDAVALGLIKKGIKRDEAVVAQLPITGISPILLLACHKAGVVCCLAPLTFRRNEMRHIVEIIGATAILTPVSLRHTDYFGMAKEIARDVPQLENLFVLSDDPPSGAVSLRTLTETPLDEPDVRRMMAERSFGPFEVSSVVLSSGTTGMPKCIEHTGASSLAGGRGIVERTKLTPEDIVGIIAPLSGGPGLQNFWAALHLGAKICLLERFSPEAVLSLVEKERVTYLAAIPTQLIRIIKECETGGYDLSSLRAIRTGAAAFDSTMARETEVAMGCKVVIAAGSQETYSFAQSGVDDPRGKRIGTLGRPFPGNEVKIVDEEGREVPTGEVGLLCVRGASTSSGYFGDPEATQAAWGTFGMEGWYRTGDLAQFDEEGYLHIVGRKKDMIIRGGQNIYPAEIENLLLSHPSISQAVIIAMPDPVMGERACACIVPRAGESMTLEEVVSFLKEKGLAVHKLPERLEVMEAFPQLADGQKVDKISLTKMVLEKAGAD